jgi:DNA-binding SARP family transcriptional activator
MLVRTAMHNLTATYFGSFALYRDGLALCLPGSRLVLDLGRLLIGIGRPISRDEVLEILWPNCDPQRSGHRLHVAVSQLRQHLDPPRAASSVIRFQADAYQVAPGAIETDFQTFETSFERGRGLLRLGAVDRAAEAFRCALAVYRGDFLADRPYADWALARRAYFLERRLTAISALADHALQRNDFAAAVEYTQLEVRADGLRERAHRQLMRAYYLMGQRGLAVRQFHICAEVLERDIGVTPARLTRQLRDAIISDAELPDEPLPHRSGTGAVFAQHHPEPVEGLTDGHSRACHVEYHVDAERQQHQDEAQRERKREFATA